ncbi:MAG: ureidoglycolate lyase [Alphaproteobacteria bacterium]|nr:ureidoglycolate lyase [Alphaproteobacteria bacterium]
MSAPRLIKPEPLTAKDFAPFGDVIECSDRAEIRHINYGQTDRYHDLAALDLLGDGGRPIVSIFRSRPLPRPVAVKVMERHPLSSQAFMPLDGHPYLVLVAPKGEFDSSALKAFVAGPKQGVNYHAGTWHHYSLALDKPCDFLVIDRAGPEKNCDEISTEDENIVIDY